MPKFYSLLWFNNTFFKCFWCLFYLLTTRVIGTSSCWPAKSTEWVYSNERENVSWAVHDARNYKFCICKNDEHRRKSWQFSEISESLTMRDKELSYLVCYTWAAGMSRYWSPPSLASLELWGCRALVEGRQRRENSRTHWHITEWEEQWFGMQKIPIHYQLSCGRDFVCLAHFSVHTPTVVLGTE